jgi:hypothetical protein
VEEGASGHVIPTQSTQCDSQVTISVVLAAFAPECLVFVLSKLPWALPKGLNWRARSKKRSSCSALPALLLQ